ncbi:MAG: carboxymuconolactone decarboxylase family protein [Rhodospirillaceae bacterium]|jgi:4-carboxymuconolactone decarboxylase
MTDKKDSLEAGRARRREVLGDAHVDRSDKNRNAFNEDFLDIMTKFAWGDVWTRPNLDKQMRSRLTLSILIALNRVDEFKLHVKGAINNGLTPDDIKEVIIHASVYAGIPAAVSAFSWANEVLTEMGEI